MSTDSNDPYNNLKANALNLLAGLIEPFEALLGQIPTGIHFDRNGAGGYIPNIA